MKPPPIYVEILIRGEMEELWRLTQTPDRHQRWDLRFTEIKYLPRPDPAQPQKFLYATRIGFGVRISGEGESVGEHTSPTSRTSSLKFWSHEGKSLIEEGSGYWKYIESSDGIRFLTRYDYRTRWGVIGAVVDRVAFRPLLGWATAWSFDRLRLWIERGIDPGVSMQRSLVHAIARIGLALIWIYQGLVPKLLFTQTSGEMKTVTRMGVPNGFEHYVLWPAGAGEIGFGLALLFMWRTRWLFALNVFAMIALLLSIVIATPNLLVEQFNPASLNVSMIALALCGWVVARDLPTAKNCLRTERRPQ